MIDEVISLVKQHTEWREKKTLNLIPSENVTSPAVRSLLSSDLGHRYTSRDKFYAGTRFVDEIEQHGEKLAKELFGAATADLRPLSGHISDFVVLASFTKPRDRIMCISTEHGGYPGSWKEGLSKILQLKPVAFPFQKDRMNIEVSRAEQLIKENKPRMIIFGASLMLFPQPVKALVEAAQEIEAHVCYDGSHVLGLIAGKEFQDPLREGATVLFGSTHKSFFGPQGGIILADAEHGNVIKRRIFPALVDNAHWNRIAGLTLALAEMKIFGQEYAAQVVKNAQTLARALAEHGFPVACSTLGFTKSHQVYLDYGNFGGGMRIARSLEKANIVADRGVRLGVCEATRKGMKQKEMLRIADLIKRTDKDREQPSKIKTEVAKLVEEFQKIRYCF